MRHKFTRMAEIGVRSGETTRFLLENCPDLSITAVDLWQTMPAAPVETYEGWPHAENYAAVRKLAEKFPDRIHIRRVDSVDAAKFYSDGWFDLVFLDGDHSSVGISRDIDAWWPKIGDGGLLVGHDLTWLSVHYVVYSRFSARGYSALSDKVWLVKKNGPLRPWFPGATRAAVYARMDKELLENNLLP